ncbi:hypothetical protein AB8Z38_06715 [Bradyrhizobium sp. LLZ17]|uniref:Uncharacterized protein n=1 Tax=Bradyrhizobium sp. LLZ17 TaxID=3239388 RepID=A0AB39XNU2_9BRAD
MSEMVDVETWMQQVNEAVAEFNAVIAGIDERLVVAEGQNWALTRLLYSFVKREILPREAAKKQVREMIAVIKEHEAGDLEKTFLDSAQRLFEELVDDERPPQPPSRFSVIQGGKSEK